MTCTIDRCASAGDCTRHLALLLTRSDARTARRSAAAEAALDRLAAELRELRSGSARRELRGCATLLQARFSVDLGGGRASLAPDRVLATGVGAPLVLGAIAATAARRAGIALGLIAGSHGRYAVAHATLAHPLVLDLGEGFAQRDVAGCEHHYRWLCAHETAQRVTELRVAATRRTGPRSDRRTAAARTA